MKPLLEPSGAGPIFGDPLRLLLYAARLHPDEDLRRQILIDFDNALAEIGVRPVAQNEMAAAVSQVVGPALAPMTFAPADMAILSRILPACRAAGWGNLFLGSADAVGQGYGTLIDGAGRATYHSRERRGEFSKPLAALNLGMLPARSRVTPTSAIKARFAKSQKHGVSIRVRAPEFANSPLASQVNSLVFLGNPNRGVRASPLDQIGLVVDLHRDEISIAPRTSEAAIRFASICASGALLCLACEERPGTWHSAVLIALTSFGAEPVDLAAEWWSSRGPLAEWAHTPVLPLKLDVMPETRSRVSAWLAEALAGNGVSDR